VTAVEKGGPVDLKFHPRHGPLVEAPKLVARQSQCFSAFRQKGHLCPATSDLVPLSDALDTNPEPPTEHHEDRVPREDRPFEQ
jgi:hypothetical protein